METENAAAAPPRIYAAMLSILAELESIPKDRTASEAGGRSYKYRGIDDALAALNPLFAQHGVFVLPMVEGMDRWTTAYKSGTPAFGVSLRVRYRFYASDGSFVDAIVQADGLDSGDKGVYKALSGAMKYAIFQSFCIPTEEPKDAETQTHDLAPAAKPRAAAPRPAPAAAKPAAPSGAEESSHPITTGEVWRFGKHKGQDIGHTPTKYLVMAISEDGWMDGKPGPYGGTNCTSGQYAKNNAKMHNLIVDVLKKRKAAQAAPAPAAEDPAPEDTTDHGYEPPMDDIPF